MMIEGTQHFTTFLVEEAEPWGVSPEAGLTEVILGLQC